MFDTYKVGMTSDLTMRIKQLSTTHSIPSAFVCEFYIKVTNARETEKQIHKLLHDCRVNSQREFFHTDISEIKAVFSKFGEILYSNDGWSGLN